jgi:hypothetical protein
MDICTGRTRGIKKYYRWDSPNIPVRIIDIFL